MDVTASTITVVSSVWTLTIHCKQLIEGIKNSDARTKELARKAQSFATVIGQIGNAYNADATEPENPQISPEETKIREDVRKELSYLEEDLRVYENEVSSLLRQRKSGKFGVHLILNTWREKVAAPALDRVEKSIEDHQSYLQSLMDIHHGCRLEETRKDLKKVLTAIDMMFEKIEALSRSQQLHTQESPLAGGMGRIERRDSNITLVNALRDDGDETPAGSDSENSIPLHALAQQIFKGLLGQLAPGNGSIPQPNIHDTGTNGLGISVQVPPTEAITSLDPAFHAPKPALSEYVGAQIERSSFDPKGWSNVLSALYRSTTQPLEAPSESTSSGGSTYTQKRKPTSGISQSSTLARTVSNGCIVSDDEGKSVAEVRTSLGLLDKESHGRADKAKGAELLKIVKCGTGEAFETLLQSDASLEEKDEKGKTALIVAASLNKVNFVEKLLRYEADVQAADKNGATALHNAIESSSWSTVSLLLEFTNCRSVASIQGHSNPKINLPDKNGRTPLHCCTYTACAEGDMERVSRELIDCGANIEAKDKAELPPVYYAIKNRRESVVELFLDKGASLDFERPETSSRIGMLLDNHILGKQRSPRTESTKSPKNGRKRLIFLSQAQK